MISDEERKIVAANLRQYLKKYETPDWRAFCNIILGSGRLDNLRKAQAFDRLADLIDRPTCTVSMGVTGHVGVCMRCGAMIETRAAVFNAIEALPTRYCPNCGVKLAGEPASRAVTQQR